MTKRMLIDATHAEETRVAVIDGNRLVEFDYESKFRKPLKGSIFLAKVTRVEPSLQAAFVNFGGNRHGFLPFSEIHPDYFRIPISDREALIAEQEELLREAEEEAEKEEEQAEEETLDDDDQDDEDLDEVEEIGGNTEPADDEAAEEEQASEKEKPKGRKKSSGKKAKDSGDDGKDEKAAKKSEEKSEEEEEEASPDAEAEETENSTSDEDGEETAQDQDEDRGNNRRRGRRGGRGRYNNKRGGNRRAAHRSRQVEILGGTEYDDDDSNNAAERARFAWRRKYKIQEVIKRGQIMLIQVSREERGNKGAAVSTYLSLPGRYGVLMPNSPRAGGVSRKIANQKDRARLRDMLKEFDTPKGMSVILRTAGVSRTKTEIKRDVDYLMRLWGDIRELTLNSSAPALIYEEADLMKRAIRDLYTREVEEIMVAGKEGHDTAKKFMKMMIPSHAKRVKEYTEDVPLFHRYQVESQISEISEPSARLKSGGYLVINPTEALVSIDVNSGRATKERHIEETALNTNMEAAEEVARQLRLRDLGGLVVVDFIDMEDRRNNAKVERKLKEALSNDRARIQIGRISSFGLLEMSRQRLNPSLTEAQFEVCKSCNGVGHIRTPDATCIMLLRAIEEEGIKARAAEVIVHVSNSAAIYLLNNKRTHLDEIESRYTLKVLIRVDDALGPDKFRIEVSKPAEGQDPSDEPQDNNDDTQEGRADKPSSESGREGGRRRGRRGGRGRGRNREQSRDEEAQENDETDQDSQSSSEDGNTAQKQGKANDKKEEKETSKAAEKEDKKSGDQKPKSRAKSSRTKTKTDDKKEESSDDKSESKTEKKDEEKSEKSDKPKKKSPGRPRKKAEEKSSDKKEDKAEKSSKSGSAKKAPEPSNDTKPAPLTAKEDKPYENVNEAPDKPKKGWWNRLMD